MGGRSKGAKVKGQQLRPSPTSAVAAAAVAANPKHKVLQTEHASKSAATLQPSDWREYFSDMADEAVEQSQVTRIMRPAAHMRPANRGYEVLAVDGGPELPAENVLLQAQVEGTFDVDAVVAALTTLFGRDLEPFVRSITPVS